MNGNYHFSGLLWFLLAYISSTLGQLTIKEHRTQAAAVKENDLWCYACDSMEDGQKCVTLAGNHSSLYKKCKDDKRICMVKRFSHTFSTENSTSIQQMWSLERNCTKHCEAGCIVIGERTKLYACTSCCERSFCNNGTGTGLSIYDFKSKWLFFKLSVALVVFNQFNRITLFRIS